MDILVTGAAGFLGRHFSRAIRERWPDARLVLNDLVTPDLGLADEVWQGDILRYLADGESESFEDFDLVFHFAAPVGGRVKIETDPMFNARSLEIDSALFRWAATGRVKTIVYPSSSAVYPVNLQAGDAFPPLHEGAFWADAKVWGAPDEMYGFTKMAGEVLACKAARYGVNTLCIRPFSGYGPGQASDYPYPAIARRALAREDPLTVWGSGMQVRDPVHVDDIVEATLARLHPGVAGYQAMNIASGVGLSMIELARAYAAIVGYSPKVEAIGGPEGVMRRVGDPTEMRRFYQLRVNLVDGLTSVLDSLE